MYRDKKIMYYISSSLFLLLSFALFLPIGQLKILIALILVVYLLLTIFLIKKRSILSLNKKEVLLLMFVIGLVYIMGFYLTGLKFGYYKSYKLTLTLLLNQILPTIGIIISIEIIRSVLLAQDNKVINVLSFLSGVIVDILLFSSLRNISTFNQFMDLVGMNFIPAILNNLLYHFLSKKYGFYPNIIFRLVITLYPYILPIVPATPDSLAAFIKLLLPIVIYLFINVLYEKKKRVESHKSRGLKFAGYCALIMVMVSIAMLISCQFKYGLMVIGSDSMTGELNKGDAIIFVRYEDQIIKEGQVILFDQDGTDVIHRVVKIERINGQNRYYTKGDANDDWDAGFRTDSDIFGITNFKIAYIGYPTVWIRDIFVD